MDYLILVNRFEPLPEGYGEKLKLKTVQGKLFETQTAIMLETMLDDALDDGIRIRRLSADAA